MHRAAAHCRRWLAAGVCLLALAACGGGSSVSVGGGQNMGLVVGGAVSMPNGQVAAAPSALEWLAQALVARVEALVAGNVRPVGGGVPVTLLEISEHNVVGGQIQGGRVVFQATTDSDGAYSVRLPKNTDPNTCRFVLEVGSAAAHTLTRAFVYARQVDIDFQSEAAVRLILDQVKARTTKLCNLDANAIASITDAVRASPNPVSGDSAAAVNSSAEVAAAADAGVQDAIAQAIGAPTPLPSATDTAPPNDTPASTSTATVALPTATAAPPTVTRTPPPNRTATTTPATSAAPSRTPTSATGTSRTPTTTGTNTTAPTTTATTATTTTVPSTATTTAPPTATNTAVSTVTNTAVSTTVTAVATNTATHGPTNTVPPTATSTVQATSTTPTSTVTATATDTATPTDTPVNPATSTPTLTGVATATITDTPVNAATSTPTLTGVATATITDTPVNAATSTPTLTPTPTPTNTAVVCPLTAGKYTQTTTGGVLKVATFASFTFPANGVTIQDVSAGNANCVHQTVVPFPGGFTTPNFCVPALGATTSVTQSGCGVGEIDSNGGSDFTVNENGDTSEQTVCGVHQTTCPGAGPAPDSSGRLDIKVGDGTADTCSGGTANAIVTIPVNTLTWVAADSSCPDTDGTFNPGTDTQLAAFPQTLDLTTDTAVAQFTDLGTSAPDPDLCKKSGLGPLSYTGVGPNGANGFCQGAGNPSACCTGVNTGTCIGPTGKCIDIPGMTVSVAAAGTIFSSGGPTYDLLFTTVQNSAVAGPAAPLGATCGSPPVINFTGMATRCLVGP